MKAYLYPEEEIIDGCKKEKRFYQELLYRRFASKMYGVCLSYAKDREQAQDIMHDAFMKIFKSIKSYKGDGSLEGWIRRIITNTAIDHLRKKQKDFGLITEEIPDVQENEPELEQYITMPELLAQVERLPGRARMVFNLYTLEGLTHVEIASRLNITVGTSKSQFKRARSLLKQWLRELQEKKQT